MCQSGILNINAWSVFEQSDSDLITRPKKKEMSAENEKIAQMLRLDWLVSKWPELGPFGLSFDELLDVYFTHIAAEVFANEEVINDVNDIISRATEAYKNMEAALNSGPRKEEWAQEALMLSKVYELPHFVSIDESWWSDECEGFAAIIKLLTEKIAQSRA